MPLVLAGEGSSSVHTATPEPTTSAASSAGDGPMRYFLLVKELGTGNVVEQTFPEEVHAREASAKLWASWVLPHRA